MRKERLKRNWARHLHGKRTLLTRTRKTAPISKSALFFYLLLALLVALVAFALIRANTYREILSSNPVYSGCLVVSDCGDYVGIECNSDSYGARYYANKTDGAIICGFFGPANSEKTAQCPEGSLSCKDDLLIRITNYLVVR